MDVINIINEALLTENVSPDDIYDIILHRAGQIDGQILNDKQFWQWAYGLLNKHMQFTTGEFLTAYRHAFDATAGYRTKVNLPPKIASIRDRLSNREHVSDDEMELYREYMHMISTKQRKHGRHRH